MGTTDLARIPLLDELTPRQRAFVTNPQVMIDPVLAAMQSGYSDEYAKRFGWALRKELWYFIQAGPEAQSLRASVTPRMIVDELGNLAFSNLMDFFEVVDQIGKGGKIIGSMMVPKQNFKAMPAHLQRLIKRIRFDTFISSEGLSTVYVSDIELHGKEWALKEHIEMLRLRQQKPDEDTQDLLQYMDESDLKLIEAMFTRAADNKRKALEKKSAQSK